MEEISFWGGKCKGAGRQKGTTRGTKIPYKHMSVCFLVKGTLKECIELYSIQEQAQTRLATTLKATQIIAVGMSATELYNLASAFQEVTTYGDEAIIGVEALFVSTGKIAKDVMPSAISFVPVLIHLPGM